MAEPIRSLKRLDMDNKGNFTLEERIVHPTLISPPFLAYYQGSLQANHSVISSFEELRELPKLRMDQLPVHVDPRMSWYTSTQKCDAFMMSSKVARELRYQKSSELVRDPHVDTLWVYDWVAISFYKLFDGQEISQ